MSSAIGTPCTMSSSLVKDFETHVVYCGNEFPSDDFNGVFAALQRHSRDNKFPFLNIFLTESTAMIKREVAALPQELREALPPFQNIASLANYFTVNRHAPLAGALDGALLCILQTGMLIGHYESQGVEYTLHRHSARLVGLSIGLMTAAAISVSSSLSDLSRAGLEGARVAFRLAVHVERISCLIEPKSGDEKPASWAYVVPGLTGTEVQEELDRFNTETLSSPLNKVFISAADKTSVSVSGPPSRLAAVFLTSQLLRYSKHFPMPVYYGLCHAPHIYSADDVHAVVHGSNAEFNHKSWLRIPVFSPQNGEPFLSNTLGNLLEDIVSEIMTGPICLDKLSAGVIGQLGMSSDCHFTQFRSSIVSRGLVSEIENELPQLNIVKEDLLDWTTKERPQLGYNPTTTQNAKLAVVGTSCRLPGGAANPELFWKLMANMKDVHTTIPADRFDVNTHYDPTGKTPNSTETPYGCFIENPGHFDAGFFNMSPVEAEQVDPMHRLAIVTAYEALEMSGYSPNRTPSTCVKRVGTYYGCASDDWREVNGGQNIATYAVPGTERAFANGRINYFFKFGGPSFNMDTACSSGLAAVNAACSALWAGEADTVLAGGLNVISNCDNYACLSRGHFLSKTGQCKVWDEGADGYCRADGVVSMVIKRLEDAEADNDNVLAVICSATTNHSAEAISITHPHAGAQMENYGQVMAAAGVSPLDVGYVELHGTGTQAGDAVESESVATVFAPRGTRRRPEQRLHLGAVKSNIGHSEAAAGITSLLKVLLIYQKNQIPPHIGIKTRMNPVVAKNLDNRNTGLVFEMTPWPKVEKKKRYAIVNSFGAHGGNTTLLLEDAPEKAPIKEQDPRSSHPITLSAKSKASLKANAEALLEYLDEHPETDLGDLSYTLCARRIHHPLRLSTSVSSLDQLKKFLTSSLDKISDIRPIPSTGPPSVVMTFTGQGAFYDGMTRQLYQLFPPYRAEIQQLDSLVQKLGLPSILSYIEDKMAENEEAASPDNQKYLPASPMTTQLCILITEIALTRFWKLLGVVPDAVIGHSLGEYAALVAAGVLSAVDAILLVAKRAMLLAEHCTPGSHAMLSVRASAETISDALSSSSSPDLASAYEISCQNGPADTVISASQPVITAIRTVLSSSPSTNIKTILLDVPYAFHTAQMDPVLPAFQALARNVTFKPPAIPIISPLLSDCVFDDKTISASYLCRASREPVLFVDALDAARDMSIVDDRTVWLEVGPHPVNCGLVRNWLSSAGGNNTGNSSSKTMTFASVRRDEDNFATLAATLAALHGLGVGGPQLRWNEYFRPYERSHVRLLSGLRAYRWNVKNYWLPYGGTWCLDKFWYAQGMLPPNRMYANGGGAAAGGGDGGGEKVAGLAKSSLRTSSVHHVLDEEVLEGGKAARITAVSDLKHPSLLPATRGHMMNGHPVATSSIWMDMARTIGEHLYKLAVPSAKQVDMRLADSHVAHAQVIGDEPIHLIQIRAELDLAARKTDIKWFDYNNGQVSSEHFASMTVLYEDAEAWKREWQRVTHLVSSRVDDLNRLAVAGLATRVNRKMAYTLFGNVVDYADEYRGMQTVSLLDLEAAADITLAADGDHGSWHSPPHYIDSVCHLGGLVLNGSDGAANTKDFFYVTPGFGDFRFIPQLKAGDSYRAYVRMEQSPTEANQFAGDVYILQGAEIVGMMGQMKFNKVPRMLMNHFFSPSATAKAGKKAAPSADLTFRPAPPAAAIPEPTQPQPAVVPAQPVQQSPAATTEAVEPAPAPAPEAPASTTAAVEDENSMITDCIRLISKESGLAMDELHDEASFPELGIDSLMSLVLSEKFKSELGLDVKSSIFLECPNIGALKEWLNEYC